MAHVAVVVEAPWFEEAPPWPWPIAPLAPFSWLPISGASTEAEVGSFFARLVTDNSISPAQQVDRVFDAILAEEELIMPGGLQIQGEGVVINPGCCCGLETWREWLELSTSGDSLWLGHDPSPWVECIGDRIRVWADGRMNGQRISGNVELERASMLRALHSVRNDLIGFLQQVARWEPCQSFAGSTELIVRLDTAFQISAAL